MLSSAISAGPPTAVPCAAGAVLVGDAAAQLLDAHDAVHVGGPQPEHVLHALQRGDGVDVPPQRLERGSVPVRSLVLERRPGTAP